MGFVVGVLSVCAGILLAALDSPQLRDKIRVKERASIVLLAAVAASVAAGVVQAVRTWLAM